MSLSRRHSSEKPSSQETVRDPTLQQTVESTSSKKISSSAAGTPSSRSSRRSNRYKATVDSDPEEAVEMPSSSKSHSSSSSKKHSSSSSKSRPSKSDNWTDVTEPEERRRIQNRLAQRKFREKAKEQKERSERDARNQELAGSSYTVPSSEELLADNEECSGLPWGSISMRHVVSRGHAESHRSRSGHDDHAHDDNMNIYGGTYNTAAGYVASQQTMTSPSYHSYGSHDNSSGGGGDYIDDGTFYYDQGYDALH